MNKSENEAADTITFLIETARGTSELWLRRIDEGEVSVFQPMKLVPVSGCGAEMLGMQHVADSIALDEWMADHFEVFSEGRTVRD